MAPDTSGEVRTHHRAHGTFAVTLTPLPADHDAADARLARRAIDKQFEGDLTGVSRGEMISAGTTVQDSAAYSALERVEGALGGRHGAFTFQHTGVMARGTPSLVITVVPDSGTDALAGWRGAMTLQIASGQHRDVFDSTLSPPPLPAAPPVGVSSPTTTA